MARVLSEGLDQRCGTAGLSDIAAVARAALNGFNNLAFAEIRHAASVFGFTVQIQTIDFAKSRMSHNIT
ncbi:hypothetical protein PMI41_00102 [Phyllobacterium sp. YR531]|nr:hypothetical protein PMI41_00102 [Phyllobacterium sp. YR531]